MRNYASDLTRGNSCCHLKGWNGIVIASTLICGALRFDGRTHFYASHNNNAEWRELLEHEPFAASRLQMHSEDNLAVTRFYSQIMKGVNMFIHLGLKWAFYFRNLCFRFNRLTAFEYVHAWRRLNISIQEALPLIPQVRKSHKMWCLLKSFTPQHLIAFICQLPSLHTLSINWLHLMKKKKTLSRVCDTFMIMHGVPWITRSKTHFYLSQTAAVLLWRYTNDTTDLRWAILINMQALSGCSDLWLMKMTALFNKYSQESRCGRVDCLPSLLLHCPWRLLFFWLRCSNFRWRQRRIICWTRTKGFSLNHIDRLHKINCRWTEDRGKVPEEDGWRGNTWSLKWNAVWPLIWKQSVNL